MRKVRADGRVAGVDGQTATHERVERAELFAVGRAAFRQVAARNKRFHIPLTDIRVRH